MHSPVKGGKTAKDGKAVKDGKATPTKSGKTAHAEEKRNNTVVLLADIHLLELPLEALLSLRVLTVTAISRDFSLQFFHHRFTSDPARKRDRFLFQTLHV